MSHSTDVDATVYTEAETILDTLDPNPDLAWFIRNLPADATQIVTGIGTTVAPGFRQAVARIYFLKILHRIEPNVSWTLLADEGRSLYRAFGDALIAFVGTSSKMLNALEAIEGSAPGNNNFRPGIANCFICSPEALELERAGGQLEQFIHSWQTRWALTEPWFVDAAKTTLHFGEHLGGTTEYWSGHLLPDLVSLCTSPYDGKASQIDTFNRSAQTPPPGVFRWSPPHKQIDTPVYLDDLKHPPYETDDGNTEEDDGWIGTFDTRTDTVDAAVKRLLPTLGSRLRRQLNSIEADDRTLNGAVTPVSFRKTTAFERLVRYQVVGESRKRIAAADGVDYAGVHKAVKDTAALIGLTLRKETGGRPRTKAHAR